MGFAPIAGYSEDRTSTVFTDGNNNQRAEFNFILSTGWTPVSYDENRTSVLLQNGDIKQRATVTYNSGITAEHITAYDAYATDISQAQTTANKADTAATVAQQTANLVGQNLQSVTEKIPAAASSSNLLVDTATMNTALSTKADSSSLGTMSTKDADNYSTTEEANLLYSPIQSSVTDTSSTSITLANADANTVYHYGTLDSLTITAADTSDLETIIWFTPSVNLTGITIPETLQPLNEFNPVTGKLACLSILNGTIVYGSVL